MGALGGIWEEFVLYTLFHNEEMIITHVKVAFGNTNSRGVFPLLSHLGIPPRQVFWGEQIIVGQILLSDH